MNDILVMMPVDIVHYNKIKSIYAAGIKSDICCYVRDYLFKNRGQIDMEVLSKYDKMRDVLTITDILPTINESLDRIDLVGKPIDKIYIDCLLCTTSVMIHIKPISVLRTSDE